MCCGLRPRENVKVHAGEPSVSHSHSQSQSQSQRTALETQTARVSQNAVRRRVPEYKSVDYCGARLDSRSCGQSCLITVMTDEDSS